MRKSSVFTLIVIWLIICGSGAMGLGKITVDPNTPENAPVVAPTDARVNQKVTYTAKKQTVARILADLSSTTGITLNAGFNDQDWQVRDRKMNIIVKDLPLVDLMNSISRTMKFLWKQEGDPATPSYRLYMDRRAVILAEILRQREVDKAAKEIAQGRENLLSAISSLSNLSDGQINNLKADNPYLYALASSGIASELNILFTLCPQALEAASNGVEWSINAAKLPASAQEAILRLLPGLRKMQNQQYDPTTTQNPVPDDLASKLSEISISLNSRNNIQSGYVFDIGVGFPNHNFGDYASVWFPDPTSPIAKALGEFTISLWDDKDTSYLDALNQYEQKALPCCGWYTAIDRTGDPLAQHADDPDLKKIANIKIDPQKLYNADDFEDMLVQYLGLNVVAETYNGFVRGVSFSGFEENSLGNVLGFIQNHCASNWWKRGNLVEVRYRQWYKKRLAQIPEAWIEKWHETFKTTGTLDINDLSDIAILNWEQYSDNVLSDELLNNRQYQSSELAELIQSGDSHAILAFYANLTARQKAMIFTDRGLDLWNIRPDKRPSLEALLGAPSNPSSLLNPEVGTTAIKLFGKSKKKDKVNNYKLELWADTGEGMKAKTSWDITTPLYIEPKKVETPK